MTPIGIYAIGLACGAALALGILMIGIFGRRRK